MKLLAGFVPDTIRVDPAGLSVYQPGDDSRVSDIALHHISGHGRAAIDIRPLISGERTDTLAA
ncbi:MAG: hypothetical protein AB7R89_07690 [Dehalococcoidia bacterium]